MSEPADLAQDAKVRSRLVTVAGSEVAEELREEGSLFHPSTSGAEQTTTPDSVGDPDEQRVSYTDR